MAVMRVGSGLDYRVHAAGQFQPSITGAVAPAVSHSCSPAQFRDLIRLSLGVQSLNKEIRSAAINFGNQNLDGGFIVIPSARTPGGGIQRGSQKDGQDRAGNDLLRQTWAEVTSDHSIVPLHLPVSYGRSLWIPEVLPRRLDDKADHARSSDSGVGDSHSPASSLSSSPDSQSLARAGYFQFDQICGSVGLKEPGAPVGAVLSSADFLSICRLVQNYLF